MSKNVKSFIKRHKRLLKIARFILRRNKKVIVYSWDDVGMMVSDWCRFLPMDFDCIIGIPRAGLVIADLLALELGLPLSVPFCFLRGVVWNSRHLDSVDVCEFKHVLIVDDCIHYGRDLKYEVERLRRAFPEIVFEVAALVKLDNSYDLDYFYVMNDNYLTKGELPELKNIRTASIISEDFR